MTLLRKIKQTILTLIRFPRYLKQFLIFKKLNTRFDLRWKDRYMFLFDNTGATAFDRHYVYHTAWMARKLQEANPKEHHDFSSYLYFSTICSAFVPITFYDYRPAAVKLNGLSTRHEDLTCLTLSSNSLTSISCMHVLEHIGLGRYGDPLDIDGDLKACRELVRVLSNSGDLYIVLPVGKPRIQFNAHRIYSFNQVVRTMFADLYLVDWALILEHGNMGLISRAEESAFDGERYGCGCFHFRKL